MNGGVALLDNLLNPRSVLGWIELYGAAYIFLVFRYVLVSGTAYLLVWKWGAGRFRDRKIQASAVDLSQVRSEQKWSLLSFVYFAGLITLVVGLVSSGHTQIYQSVSDHGWGYFVFSALMVIVAHDAYFYWTHRLMHHPKIYRWAHAVHHYSKSPTPWAVFSFHPIETVIESGILPIVIFTFPVHPLALLIAILYLALMNMIGHLGYEFFPAAMARTGLWNWLNVTTHHDFHHQTMRGNYSLYFNVWDRLCGTNDPGYRKKFLDLKAQAGLQHPS